MTETSSGADETSTTDRVRGAGTHVAGTAAEEASNVKHEVGAQARNLVGEVRTQLSSQVSTQQERAAGGIRSMSDELRSMADSSQSSGVASSLVSQAASRAGDVAGWLEGRDPAGLLDDVKRFARRRPGLFIAIAAGTGIVVGRLAKSLASGNDSAAGSAANGTARGANGADHGAHTTSGYTTGYTEPTGYDGTPAFADTVAAGSPDYTSGNVR